MSTVQVAGIAIAAVILIVLVISLVVTRRKGTEGEQTRRPEPPIAQDGGSLFDEAPRDELHMLGKRDVAAPPEEPPAPWQSPAVVLVEEPTPLGPTAIVQPVTQLPEEPTDELPVVGPADAPAEMPSPKPLVEPAPLAEDAVQPPEHSVGAVAVEPVAESAGSSTEDMAPVAEQTEAQPSADHPVEGHTDASPAEQPAEEEADVPSRMVRLSDIIVTTNEQQVDLADPDVRRMLKDLVQDEIDLAAQYREMGQNIDAVLQLTEARRICDALGMVSHAKLIQQMINELQ